MSESAVGNRLLERARRDFAPQEAELLARIHDYAREKAPHEVPVYLRTANVLLDHGADAATVAGALAAPLIWRGWSGADEMRQRLGPSVSLVLEDLDSPYLQPGSPVVPDTANFHEHLAAICRTPRHAFLFLASRLLALGSVYNLHVPSRRRWARQTLAQCVPVANRLNLDRLCRQLEDTCFYLLDAASYGELVRKTDTFRSEDDECLLMVLHRIETLLRNNGLKGSIKGRTKSLYGIHRKMTRRRKPLEEIMDRIGVRIVVRSVADCYTVLGLLHTHFKPIAGTFNDYISSPKGNGYQSLHTCVYPLREISCRPVEFQIRTELMHKEAEFGAAAHWRYKDCAAAAKVLPEARGRRPETAGPGETTGPANGFFELLQHQARHGQAVDGPQAVGMPDILATPDCRPVRDERQSDRP